MGDNTTRRWELNNRIGAAVVKSFALVLRVHWSEVAMVVREIG